MINDEKHQENYWKVSIFRNLAISRYQFDVFIGVLEVERAQTSTTCKGKLHTSEPVVKAEPRLIDHISVMESLLVYALGYVIIIQDIFLAKTATSITWAGFLESLPLCSELHFAKTRQITRGLWKLEIGMILLEIHR